MCLKEPQHFDLPHHVWSASRAQVPMMAVSGNHEQEPDHKGATYQAYKTRYIYPYKESKSPSHQEYSFDAAGAHRSG